MVSILIVDDDSTKVENVTKFLQNEFQTYNIKISTASSYSTGCRALSKKCFDLLILDIYLPIRDDGNPQADGGIILLREIQDGEELQKPKNILGLTAFEELVNVSLPIFEELSWRLLRYDAIGGPWKLALLQKIEYLISASIEVNDIPHEIDYCIVTALHQPELSQVLECSSSWQSIRKPGDATEYHSCSIKANGGSRSIIACAAPRMGMNAAAVLSTKLCFHFKPRFLVMVGIAAGVKGQSNLGDILIADSTWDYNTGKILADEDGNPTFRPSPQSIPIYSDLLEAILRVKSSGRYIEKIQKEWAPPRPNHDLSVVVGPIASGSAVVQNSTIVTDIQNRDRKIVGLEMEGQAIAYAALHVPKPRPKSLLIKSVCDFADSRKNDSWQEYAAYTSSRFLFQLIINDDLWSVS